MPVAALYLALGSIAPANLYFALTDPTHLNGLTGWKSLAVPLGIWLMTGFLLQGLTVIWVAGVKRRQDWNQQAERSWDWWCKVGLWLAIAGIALIGAVLVFSGLAGFVAGLDRGTVLIAGLLFMILLALLRIGDQMRR